MQKSQHTRDYQRMIEMLRTARKEAGLKQSDVARKLKTYASFVSKVESCERRIDVIEMAALCRVYGLDLLELLGNLGLISSPD